MSFDVAGYFDKDYCGKLKRLREKVNWEDKLEREEFYWQLYPLISEWKGQLPNLRDIFWPTEIDWLLTYSLMWSRSEVLIRFVAQTGYKDEPEINRYGVPQLYRTTPVHYMPDCYISDSIIDVLFEIYDKFDVNYTDDDGLTHFIVACKLGCDDVVKKFLELGQNPNCLEPHRTWTSWFVLMHFKTEFEARWLMKNGSINLWSAYESKPLTFHNVHIFRSTAITFCETINGMYQPAQIEVMWNLRQTPLHLALLRGNKNMIELLLRSGADPNLSGEDGWTPLHRICMKYDYEDSLDLFFKINDELNQPVQVDVRDELGRTPLQYAVVNLAPGLIEFLLDRGADLAYFVFPTQSHFDEYEQFFDLFENQWCMLKLERASRAMSVVECLEKRGYELNRRDALMIVKLFAKYLCKIRSREFLLRWGLEFFLELTYHQLPNKCCQKIIKNLINEDLLSICLAADVVAN
ncbi:unnamed protein product [Trichogramma brassicae]|uniref:Uncharacterized protein n=1 Tax=Trichogramma brassicae TaxID=86971 RepID=A0A6H5IWV1_9HYME|nr:unnamed protein product [Trichogramma brassicae]